MIRTLTGISLACFLLGGAVSFSHPRFLVAYAQDDWKAEFEDVCSKTDSAMALTAEEVGSLIKRCDTLKPDIEKLDESASKVYLKRLQRCRDFFVFVRDSSFR